MLGQFLTLFILFGDAALVKASPVVSKVPSNTPFAAEAYDGDAPPFPVPKALRYLLGRQDGFATGSGTGTGTAGTGISTASSTDIGTPSASSTDESTPSSSDVPTPTSSVSGVTWTGPGTGTNVPTSTGGLSTPASTDTPPTSTDTPPASTDTPSGSTDTPTAIDTLSTSSVSGVTWTGPGTGTGGQIPTDTPSASSDTPPASTDTPPVSTGVSTDASTDVPPSTTDTGVPPSTGGTNTPTPTGTNTPPAPTDTTIPSTITSWDPFLVVSTQTEPWSDMSTDVQTNSDWKSNFWLSTTGKDGQPTEVPVVHCGCICRGTCDNDDNDDDDKFIWVIFWGVPKLPSVQFSFPKLPDFHLPTCINILGIKLGDCPPESDNGDHGHSDPDDPKNKNQPPDDPDDPTPSNGPSSQPQSTPASSGESSSSSSSSCSASVVTDWFIQTYCPSTAASATECTTTSTSLLRTGCDLTGTATGTFSAGAPACPLLTYVPDGPGVAYSDPGFSYGTYNPPTITDPGTTGGGASSTPGPSTGQAPSTTGANQTTLSTVVTPSSTGDKPPSSTEDPPASTDEPSSSTDQPPSSTDQPPPSSTDVPPPSSTPEPPPKPDQGLKCTGIDNKVWMGRDAMNDAIGKFCDEAAAQGGHDKDSGSLRREYNGGSPDHIVLSMDWPQEIDFKPDANVCRDKMGVVMDSCDGNDPNNPMNWKHGGTNTVDWTKYNVLPQTEKYKAGTCSYHVHEIEEWEGVDGPGTRRDWWFYLQVSIKDADGTEVGNTGGDHIEAGDGNPLTVNGYYDGLVMTPEARGDYIQFALGDQRWQTGDKHETDTDKNVVPGCNVGGFDGDYSPAGRDMDCWVHC